MKYFSISIFIIGFTLIAIQPANAGAVSSDTNDTAEKSWKFRVLLNDTPIGYHKVNIQTDTNRLSVHTTASFDVRFLFIPVYSYQHETRETWKNDCLVSITSNTDDNGNDYFITSSENDKTIELSTRQGTKSIHGCVRTFAYWDVELLKARRLLNTQTGEYQAINLTDLGTGMLSIDEEKIQARRFRLVCEDMIINLWYTHDMHWLALESETESGDLLRYLPENTAGLRLEDQS